MASPGNGRFGGGRRLVRHVFRHDDLVNLPYELQKSRRQRVAGVGNRIADDSGDVPRHGPHDHDAVGQKDRFFDEMRDHSRCS